MCTHDAGYVSGLRCAPTESIRSDSSIVFATDRATAADLQTGVTVRAAAVDAIMAKELQRMDTRLSLIAPFTEEQITGE